ncbi:hypothetical protein V7T18_05120 [Segatella copri]
MNKFYVIIYHPSRFASLTHLDILTYRHLNGVMDSVMDIVNYLSIYHAK